jgi:hypothetical protein
MIVTTIAQIQAVLPNIASDIEYDDFKTYIQSAENWIKKEIIGAELYAKLEGKILLDAELRRIADNVIVLKAYDFAIPYMDLIQTSSGFGVVSDQNRAPASQNRVDRLIQQNRARLNDETECLIDYLESNSTYHADWKASPAFSLLTDCLITTAREFKRLVSYDGTRHEFLMLKAVMKNLTTLKLHPALSRAYVTELITKQSAGTLVAADNLVLPGIKSALANYVMDNHHAADRLLDDVVTIIDKNIEDYDTYADSDEKATKDDAGYQNAEDDAIFVFTGGF